MLQFLFSGRWTDADALASKRAIILWTNFAKTGNPTPLDGSQFDEIGDFEWISVSEGVPGARYLNFDSTLNMDEPGEYVERMNFWASVTRDL